MHWPQMVGACAVTAKAAGQVAAHVLLTVLRTRPVAQPVQVDAVPVHVVQLPLHA